MVTPHRLSSPQYISALCGEYAGTNDHALWQGAENLAEQRDELCMRSDRRRFDMAMGMGNKEALRTHKAHHLFGTTPNCHFLCHGE